MRKLLMIIALALLASVTPAQQRIQLGPNTPIQVQGVIQPANHYVYIGALSGLPSTCTVGATAFITGVAPGANDYRCTATNTWTVQGNASGNGLGNGTTVLDITSSSFRADPSGMTDSATAINNAITACKNVGGGTVLAPPGTYAIGSSLNLSLSGCDLIGYGMNVTRFKWIGSSGGTAILGTEWAYSHAVDFTIDGNNLAGIGLDFRGVNGTQVNVQDVVERVQFLNVNQSPGYGLHVGDSSNNEASECTFRNIYLGGNTNGIYQEGGQTVNITYDGVYGSSPETNDVNLRAGSAFIFHYQGGASTTGIRVSNAFNWLYADDMEIETANASFILLESDVAIENFSRSFRNLRILWSGTAAGRLFDDEQAGMLYLENIRADPSTSANSGVIYLNPATSGSGGVINLSETNVDLEANPAVISRSYTSVQFFSVNSTSTLNSSLWIPFQSRCYTVGSDFCAQMDRPTSAYRGLYAFTTGGVLESAIGNANSDSGFNVYSTDGAGGLSKVATFLGGSGGGLTLQSAMKLTVPALSALGSVSINSDATMTAAPRMFWHAYFHTTTALYQGAHIILDKPVTITRVTATAIATTTTSTDPIISVGVSGTYVATITLATGNAYWDSGSLSVAMAAGPETISLTTAAIGATTPTQVNVDVEYVMQ